MSDSMAGYGRCGGDSYDVSGEVKECQRVPPALDWGGMGAILPQSAFVGTSLAVTLFIGEAL